SAATVWARPRCAKASWACSGQVAARSGSAARTSPTSRRHGSRVSASAMFRRAAGCGARSAWTSICGSPPASGAGPGASNVSTRPFRASPNERTTAVAISRALLTNPHLLVMDEPTEGLAPVIVAQVEEMLVRLGEEGDISVLVIEQNIGVATAVSKNVAIMVNGRINRIIDSGRLSADRELQQRLLGVGVHAEAGLDVEATETRPEAEAVPQRAPGSAPIRLYVSNPTL